MLLAGTKSDVNGFGWKHLAELLNDLEIDAIVQNGLTEREQKIVDYCARVAYSFDHDNSQPAYSGSGANIAGCLTNKFFRMGYDSGSPYTSHDDCACNTCRSVRQHNAKLGGPFHCNRCGRRDKSRNSAPSNEQWTCPKCLAGVQP
jgi:hypothetical protein